MSVYIYPPTVATVDTGFLATAAKQDEQTTLLTDIENNTDGIEGELTTLNAKDFATSAKQDSQTSLLTSIESDTTSIDSKLTTTNSTLSNIQSTLSAIEASDSLDVVDQIDLVLLDTSSTNIPASSGNPLELIATLAADVKKIISVEDIGSYMGLYVGPALAETLKCVLPLGGGEVELLVPSGARISIRALEDVAISSGSLAINFLG